MKNQIIKWLDVQRTCIKPITIYFEKQAYFIYIHILAVWHFSSLSRINILSEKKELRALLNPNPAYLVNMLTDVTSQVKVPQ